jgi:hypothetical protein
MDHSTSASISIFSYNSPGCLNFCCCARATTSSQSISTFFLHLLTTGKFMFVIPPDVIRSSPFTVSPLSIVCKQIPLDGITLFLSPSFFCLKSTNKNQALIPLDADPPSPLGAVTSWSRIDQETESRSTLWVSARPKTIYTGPFSMAQVV